MLTGIRAEVLQGVRDVEGSRSPECVVTAGSDNDQDSVRDGVKVDDEWEHQPVRNDTQGSESV